MDWKITKGIKGDDIVYVKGSFSDERQRVSHIAWHIDGKTHELDEKSLAESLNRFSELRAKNRLKFIYKPYVSGTKNRMAEKYVRYMIYRHEGFCVAASFEMPWWLVFDECFEAHCDLSQTDEDLMHMVDVKAANLYKSHPEYFESYERYMQATDAETYTMLKDIESGGLGEWNNK